MPKRSLYDLAVRYRTFRARKHADRLVSEPLLDEAPALRAIQVRYRGQVDRLHRAEIAREFERAVHRRDPLDQAFDELNVDDEIAAILAAYYTNPRRKTLQRRLLEGSFVARKHAHLLEEEDVEEKCPRKGATAELAWWQVRALIGLYRVTPHEAIAVRQQIARLVAESAGPLVPKTRP